MSKTEWKLWKIFVVALGIFIIETVAVFTEDCDVYAASVIASEEIIVETAESPENGKIRENSGMPCENREQFERWLETYEQTASEESEDHSRDDSREAVSEHETYSAVSETETEAVKESVPSTVAYAVGTEVLNPDIQAYLYQRLADHHIEWFMPYAIMMAYQESHFDCTAVNQSNGLDMGLFQYRSTYWDWSSDIFDVDAQMSKYASEMSTRFNMGLSMDEAISRHNTSDHVTAVNWEYVGQVKQWLGQMEAIK